jgi:hypothetical protein
MIRPRGPTYSWGRESRVALVLSLCVVVACTTTKKKPKEPLEEDNSKAFAELAKNDREETDAGTDAAPSGWEPPKGPVYPAPFTAEQIRAATKNGRTYRYKVELPNTPPKEYAITFRNVDAAGVEVAQSGTTPKRMAWLTLQQHAEFPKDRTSTHGEKLKTPAGKFECVVYEVHGDDDEIWTYFFAKKLPGAPVFFYAERRGKRLRTVTLVEHIRGK